MVPSAYCVYRVRHVIGEGDAGVTLVFDGPISAQPGQFVMAWLPGVDERPFTVANDDPLMLTVARVGPFTDALNNLVPGDGLWIRGPYGNGFSIAGQRPLLVAGGSGAASLTLLARVLGRREQQMTVALGARSRNLMMLEWRFRELGCHVLLATDDGSAGLDGTVVDAASGPLRERGVDAVYACGPERMLCALAERVQMIGDERGIKIPCQVSLEATMKCGLGVCGNCHHGEKLVCKDGPVFDASQIWGCRSDSGQEPAGLYLQS